MPFYGITDIQPNVIISFKLMNRSSGGPVMDNTRDNMRNDAYNQIKYRIIHFEYVPGQKISEKTISTELDLGRTPVREALIRIEREELIEVIPQSGTYITKIDLQEAQDGRYVRESIEPRIMLQAATMMTDEACKKIQANLNEQQKTAVANEPDDFFDLDQDFHHAFYSLTGKDTVWQWLQMNNTQLNRFRRLRLKEAELDWDTLLKQHQRIYEAVLNKDIDNINYLMMEHLHLMLEEKSKVLGAYPDYFKDEETDGKTK